MQTKNSGYSDIVLGHSLTEKEYTKALLNEKQLIP